MLAARIFPFIAALVLYCMSCKLFSEQCDTEFSIFGKMLRGHTLKRINVSSPLECLQVCNDDFRCQSFNYVITGDVCELNNRTKEATPGDFVPNPYRYYFKRNTETGKLVALVCLFFSMKFITPVLLRTLRPSVKEDLLL